MTSCSSSGKIATSWYSLLSLSLWIHKRRDLEFLGFQHPLRCLVHQANRLRMQLPWLWLCGVWYVISYPATAMSSVSGLCCRHTRDFGQTRRASQIPGLYSYSPEISSTSIGTSTAGGLLTTPTTVAESAMTSNAGQQDNGSHSSWQRGGMEPQPSQHRDADFTKAFDSRPTDFTLDSSMVHGMEPQPSQHRDADFTKAFDSRPTDFTLDSSMDLWRLTRLWIWNRCLSLFRKVTMSFSSRRLELQG